MYRACAPRSTLRASVPRASSSPTAATTPRSWQTPPPTRRLTRHSTSWGCTTPARPTTPRWPRVERRSGRCVWRGGDAERLIAERCRLHILPRAAPVPPLQSEDWWQQPDWPGAQTWGHLLIHNYVASNMTATVAWSPLWSVYEGLPYEQARRAAAEPENLPLPLSHALPPQVGVSGSPRRAGTTRHLAGVIAQGTHPSAPLLPSHCHECRPASCWRTSRGAATTTCRRRSGRVHRCARTHHSPPPPLPLHHQTPRTSAQVTQFTAPGWRYLSVPGGGSGLLPG